MIVIMTPKDLKDRTEIPLEKVAPTDFIFKREYELADVVIYTIDGNLGTVMKHRWETRRTPFITSVHEMIDNTLAYSPYKVDISDMV